MRTFFIPGYSATEAESEYVKFVEFLRSNNFLVSAKRVYSVIHSHKQEPRIATVGEVFEPTGETVLSIFEIEHGSYLICTESRGWNMTNSPVFTGADGDDKIVAVDYFG